jgi:hypothetical protein
MIDPIDRVTPSPAPAPPPTTLEMAPVLPPALDGPALAPLAPVASAPVASAPVPPPAAAEPPPGDWSIGLPATVTDSTSPVAGGAALSSSTYALRRGRGRIWLLAAMLGAGAAAIVVLVLVLVGAGGDRGTIEVVSLPAGATVRVDGHDVHGTTPLRIDDEDLKVGHRVAVNLAGYDSWERDVSFDWGQREVSLHVVLTPLAGALHVDSAPEGAEVIVNGRFRGQTPLQVSDLLPTQDVSLELRLRGYRVERRTVPWQGKRALELSVPLARAQ